MNSAGPGLRTWARSTPPWTPRARPGTRSRSGDQWDIWQAVFGPVGDMDNYYLNNAVYLAEAFLESTKDPYYAGDVDYRDRTEHCWNGDHDRPNAISRPRYHQMFIPRIVKRIEITAPKGADLKSRRY